MVIILPSNHRFILFLLTGCEAFLSDLDKIPSIQIGNFKLRLELDDDLTPELVDVAVKELRETPEQQEKSIAELKALLLGMYILYSLFFTYANLK